MQQVQFIFALHIKDLLMQWRQSAIASTAFRIPFRLKSGFRFAAQGVAAKVSDTTVMPKEQMFVT